MEQTATLCVKLNDILPNELKNIYSEKIGDIENNYEGGFYSLMHQRGNQGQLLISGIPYLINRGQVEETKWAINLWPPSIRKQSLKLQGVLWGLDPGLLDDVILRDESGFYRGDSEVLYKSRLSEIAKYQGLLINKEIFEKVFNPLEAQLNHIYEDLNNFF